MNSAKYLNKYVNVIIDRKLGSKHPKYGYIYPINYGYVPNTISDDGEELDCYILGVFEPLEEFTGKCIAIIHRINDNDDKLVIVQENMNFTNAEIEVLTQFQERFFEHEIIRDNIVFNSLIPELSVSNIEESVKFYKKLGFNVVYKRPQNKFYFMQLENNQIMLEENNENWNVGKKEYPYGNGINISMSIKNIEKKYKQLENENIKFFLTLETHEYKVGNETFKDSEFLLQDPDGYLLRFTN